MQHWHCMSAGISLPSHVGFDPVMPMSSHNSPDCSPAAWWDAGVWDVPPSACAGLGYGCPGGPCPLPFPGERS